MEQHVPYAHPTTAPPPTVRGAAARPLVAAQGHQFKAIAANLDAQGHQQTGAQLDAEGDLLRDRLATRLKMAAAVARRERAYRTHTLLVEAMALVRRINELDDAEDYHLIAEASAGVDRAITSTRSAVQILEGLVATSKEVEWP